MWIKIRLQFKFDIFCSFSLTIGVQTSDQFVHFFVRDQHPQGAHDDRNLLGADLAIVVTVKQLKRLSDLWSKW